MNAFDMLDGVMLATIPLGGVVARGDNAGRWMGERPFPFPFPVLDNLLFTKIAFPASSGGNGTITEKR